MRDCYQYIRITKAIGSEPIVERVFSVFYMEEFWVNSFTRVVYIPIAKLRIKHKA
jgi:hypothetical protein